MKDNNLRAAIATRAAQLAAGAVKQKLWDDGRGLRDFRISDHRTAIVELSKRPDIMERAAKDVERWRCAKITTNAQKSKR